MYSVKFYDAQQKQIVAYDPGNGNKGNNPTRHEIQANEQLIGVYGQIDNRKFFRGFGFIVKVTQQ